MVGNRLDPSRSNEFGALDAPIILAREQAFQIGAAAFRPATREVIFSGESSAIEPRVMQLLIALHRAGGDVVSKDALMQSVWTGRIVGDDAINRVVSRLRSVAEKEAGGQFRIETITKVGYRLLPTSGEALDKVAVTSSRDVLGSVFTKWVSSPIIVITAIASLILLVTAAAAWLWIRPAPVAAHSMKVHLRGYRVLSPKVPATMPESINAEITAAFNADGIVGITAAPTPAFEKARAYSLNGTIYRIGDSIRVITELTNDRSGAVIWSDRVDYPSDQASKVPHKIAVDVGTIVRCGLSGAASYKTALPDPVLNNYMQYCKAYWSYDGSKTLHFARRVVAEVPDFSWGWSALGNGFMQASNEERDSQRANTMRAAGREAEDRAISLDPNNSEALAHKSYLIDPSDWIGQEKLFKSAVAAKPLDCGCEHYGYGLLLEKVGRLGAAIAQYRAATDMLALWPDSQIALAQVLVATAQEERAKPSFDAAIDLSKDPDLDNQISVSQGVETGNYDAAVAALRNPLFQIPNESRAALLAGYEALRSGAASRKIRAVQALLALPNDQQDDRIATMLGALGADHEALQMAAKRPWLFWRRSMRGILNDPDFPAVAKQLGLIAYWRASHTKPDVCSTRAQLAVCGVI